MENEDEQDERRNETTETGVEWPLQDSFGYEGVSMTTRVNVTARIQRIYWRSIEINDGNRSSASSLTVSIIENARILNKEKRMSLCCLVQGFSSVCCEVRLREDILLNRTDWQDVLCHSQGTVLSFSKLRLVERRNRKRARQLFGLIDSLKTTSSKKQQSCFVFTFDDQSTVEHVSEDKVSDYPEYSSPERLNDLNSATAIDSRRVSFCGKLLYARFTNDKYYNTKHVRLWLSGKCIAHHCLESDVTLEPTISVIQVSYSSGRTVEWDASTLLAGQLLSIQDVVFDRVNPAILTADIFSKIQVIVLQSSPTDESAQNIHEIWHRTMTTTMTDEECTCLKSLPVAGLPTLNENCRVDCLVMLEGVISGVDHENAFCWYSCFHCSSEDISEISNSISQYHCNACALEFNSPVTNIHLEVYLESTSTSTFMVKVKLLQKTIRNLLSGSEKTNSETYNVNSVLNKYLGPMHCHIAEKMQDKNSQISFKLEELDSSSWNTVPMIGLANE
ncbi:Hypothetical predicted protein [Paramuricea clavata]|uniref:Uncharacterized protein n=1 Tax=Paramuricea clavata TaxID=317549 RepID=A0A6S7G7U5_PARCT|nr:Hypothetical predicted protein [Paramuricea clavata]